MSLITLCPMFLMLSVNIIPYTYVLYANNSSMLGIGFKPTPRKRTTGLPVLWSTEPPASQIPLARAFLTLFHFPMLIAWDSRLLCPHITILHCPIFQHDGGGGGCR